MKRVCTGSVPLDYHCMDESPHVTCWSSEHRVYIVAVLLLLMPYYLATLHLQASGQAQQSVVTINGSVANPSNTLSVEEDASRLD